MAATAVHDGQPVPGLAERLSGVALEELAFAARYHGVVGCVHHALGRSPNAAARTVEEFTRLYHVELASQLRITADLRFAVEVLHAAGIPCVLVKGPALAEVVYARPDLRGFKDVDLLVRPEDFGAAVQCLEEAGAPVLDRDWHLVRQQMRGQLHLHLPRGTTLDLHWHLVNLHRRRFSIDTRQLLERARRATVGGVEVAVLEPVDALLHLCLHAALSGGDRLVWLKDLEQTILTGEIDWRLLVSRAREWGATVQAGVMLSRVAHVIDAPVPDEVIRVLLPPPTRRWAVRALERARPPGCACGEPSLSRLLVRTAGQGVQAAVRDGGRRLVHRLRRVPDRAVLTNPTLRARGGAHDREAYLASVARVASHDSGATSSAPSGALPQR